MGKSCSNYSQGGSSIGRITIEFKEQDKEFVDRLMCAVEYAPVPKELWLGSDEMLSFSEFEIYPRRRKVYRDSVELNLMAKEFDLLCLLVVNMGYVLTYGQIYEKIWGEDSIVDESNSVGCHIRSLRRKLFIEYPNAAFTIRGAVKGNRAAVDIRKYKWYIVCVEQLWNNSREETSI